MRRIISRLAWITRALGIALLLIAGVLSIYVLCFTGGTWKSFSGEMERAGLETGVPAMLSFQERYLEALGRVSAHLGAEPDEKMDIARGQFSALAEEALLREEALTEQEVSAAWENLADWLDMDALAAASEAAEARLEERQVRDIFTYLDGLALVPKKGKLASLKAASSEPAFREAYDAYVQGKEEAPSFAQYMQAIQSLVKQYLEDGGTVKDAKTWLAESFAEADLEKALAEQEPGEVSLDDDLMVYLAEEAAETGSVRGGLTEVWEELKAQEGYEAPADGEEEKEKNRLFVLQKEAAFLASMKELLTNPSFDGSLPAILAQMETEEAARQEKSLTASLEGLCAKVLEEADARSLIRLVVPFWLLCSKFVWLWIIGAALLLYGIVSDALLTRILVAQVDREAKKREKEHPQTGEAPLLQVSHLCQYFQSGSFVNKAVQDVSFSVKKGEVFGLVGESGCGKTTTGRTIIGLYDPTAGDVYFDGLRISSGKNGLPVLERSIRKDAREAIEKAKEECKEGMRLHPEQAESLKKERDEKIRAIRKERRENLKKAAEEALLSDAEKRQALTRYRRKKAERLKAAFEKESQGLSGEALKEKERIYKEERKAVKRDQIMTRMQMIFQDPIASIDPRMTVREIIAEGLKIRGVKDKQVIDARVKELLSLVGLVSEHADRYPHEFSGGQRQRIGIARALALEPELIIADEPISALDVSIQAQVINLLNDLRGKMGLTIIFIAHNLSVVKYFSDRIAVMYFGNMVETASSEELFLHPLHPYTKSLLSAIPYPDPIYEKNRKRLVYDPVRTHDYRTEKPSLREVAPGHFVHCSQSEFEKYQRELKKES